MSKDPGTELRELRESREISQRQLADHAGLAPSVVSRCEAGHDARLSTWRRLFDALGYELVVQRPEYGEDDVVDFLSDEAFRRKERRDAGLEHGR